MKVLKIVGIIVLFLAVIVIAIGLFAPAEYKVERAATINAPAEVVYKNVADLHEFEKWSPWSKLDPNAKMEYNGEPGTVGSSYHWKGNKKVGEGKMTVTALEVNRRVDQKLDFIEPFPSTADVYYIIEPTAGGQKVTWGMSGKSGFISRVFMTLMGGMDAAIGPDYEKGIKQLKEKSEAEASAAPAPTAAS
jgi:hypothetical protein